MKRITQDTIRTLIEAYLSQIPSKYNYDKFDDALANVVNAFPKSQN